MTPQQQEAVRTAARTAIAAERQAYIASDDVSMKSLLAAGVKVTRPDRKPWIEAVKPVLTKWAPSVGEKNLADIAATK